MSLLDDVSDDKVNEYCQIGKHYYLSFHINKYSDIPYITHQISIDRIYNLIGKEFKSFPVYIQGKLHHQKINIIDGIGTIFLKLPSKVVDKVFNSLNVKYCTGDINRYILENVIYKCYKKKYLETHSHKINIDTIPTPKNIF